MLSRPTKTTVVMNAVVSAVLRTGQGEPPYRESLYMVAPWFAQVLTKM
jgi:hypothetical protein